MTAPQRAQKRWRRERRASKLTTWYCSNCGKRHPLNERCPVPKRTGLGRLFR